MVPLIEAHRSDGRGARHLATHVVLLAATIAAVVRTWGTPWSLVAVPAEGIVLCAMFCAAHECVHRTAFRSRRVNDVVAALAGAPLLLPSRWFRLFHAAHHRFTQDPARDPELQGWKPVTRPGIVVHALGLAYWWAMVRVVARLALGRAGAAYLPPGHRGAVVRQARWLVGAVAAAVLASVATRSWLLVQVWIVPALVGQPFLRGYLLAEHTGCPTVPDMTVNTRTTLTNPAVRFLAWNMPFHTEHHAHPQVPFHQLPALHRAMAGQLQVVGRGYVRTCVTLQGTRWRDAGRYGGRP